MSKRFAALESLDESSDISNVWENIRGNIKTSAEKILLEGRNQRDHWEDLGVGGG